MREPAAVERVSASREGDVLAVGGGLEPPTFRLTAGRCTSSTTPQRSDHHSGGNRLVLSVIRVVPIVAARSRTPCDEARPEV